jgi:AcrR family transcriptional regulator
MGRGSFYTYFTDKLAVFRVVASEVHAEVIGAVTGRGVGDGADPVSRLHASNARYIAIYATHAKMYGLIEQVATVDKTVHNERQRTRDLHVRRVKSTIERWQRGGFAEVNVDPGHTAALLVSMTSNFCYWWLVGGEAHDEQLALQSLDDIWIRAVGLRADSRTTAD